MSRRTEQRIARRYMHRTTFRPCCVGRFCVRCWWREVTRVHRRELEAHKRKMRELSATMPPIRYVRGTDGRMRRETNEKRVD